MIRPERLAMSGHRSGGFSGPWAECSLSPITAEAGEASGRVRNAPLAGLAGSRMSHRFRAWMGRSGRRYVFSVFAGGLGETAAGLPADAAAIVIAAERGDGGTRRLLWIDQTGARPEAFLHGPRVAAVLADPRCELHLHLLVEDPAERRAIVRDLDDQVA